MPFGDESPGHQGHAGEPLARGGSVLPRGRTRVPERGPTQAPPELAAPGPSPSEDAEQGPGKRGAAGQAHLSRGPQGLKVRGGSACVTPKQNFQLSPILAPKKIFSHLCA